MNILISGATGFLGARLANRLKQEGHGVIGLGRNNSAGAELSLSGIEFLQIDLSSKLDLAKLPKKVDAIVHCAALSSVWGRPEDFNRCNVLATKNLTDYGLSSGCRRFVHISSPSIYVDYSDRLNIKEDEPLPKHFLNDYIRTKRMAEDIVDQATAMGLPAITLRPQGIVGQGDRSIFPRIIKTAKRGFIPRIGGDTHTDLTHVDNVVEAICCALIAPTQFQGRKYNITNGEPIEIYAFIESLMKQIGVSFRWKNLSFRKAYAVATFLEWTSRNILRNTEPLLTRYTVCALGVSRTLNIDRARAELKYNPKVSLSKALDEMVNEMKKKGN